MKSKSGHIDRQNDVKWKYSQRKGRFDNDNNRIYTWKAWLTSKSFTLAPELKMHDGFPYIFVVTMNNALE